MPSEKRARQRAAREQKQAVIEKEKKRRRFTRRGIAFGILAALIILVVFLVNSSAKTATPTTTTKPSTSTSSTSTSSTVPPTTFATPTTQPLTTKAVLPTCPPVKGSSKRVVWFTKAPPACIPLHSVWDATFTTSVGKIVARMPAAASFAAVNNFVFLARYRYFDGTFFHRVLIGFVVQGGDPTGTGTGGPDRLPGYSYTGNFPPSSCTTTPNQAACYKPGDLVLANSSPTGCKAAQCTSSDGSQFFFILPGGQTTLNGEPNYTLFGKVISGMSVVDKIGAFGAPITSATGTPTAKVYLLSVTVKQISG